MPNRKSAAPLAFSQVALPPKHFAKKVPRSNVAWIQLDTLCQVSFALPFSTRFQVYVWVRVNGCESVRVRVWVRGCEGMKE